MAALDKTTGGRDLVTFGDVVEHIVIFETLAELIANTTELSVGTRVTTREGFVYEVVDGDGNLGRRDQAGNAYFVVTADARAFGAGVAGDVHQEVQWFFDAIANHDYGSAHFDGIFQISRPVVLTHPVAVKTVSITGRARIIATAPMQDVLTFERFFVGQVECLRVEGDLEAGEPTCAVGVLLKGCRQSLFTQITAHDFAFGGVVAYAPDKDSNNNHLELGQIQAARVGSGSKTQTQSGTWTLVDEKRAADSGQFSEIEVSTLAPTYVRNGDYGPVGTVPFFVRVAGRLHHVDEVLDQNHLRIFPTIEAGVTDGHFEYVYGGGIYLKGSAAGIGIRGLAAFHSGIALASAGLYGPHAARIQTEACGVAISVGQAPNSAAIGGHYTNCYFENNIEDLILISRGGSDGVHTRCCEELLRWRLES